MVRAIFLGILFLVACETSMAQANASSYTTGYRYDSEHQIVGVISPDPDGAGSLQFPAVRNTYDGDGRIIKVEKGELAAWQPDTILPSNWTGFTIEEVADTTYDNRGLKIKNQKSSGGVTYSVVQYSYDNLRRLQYTAVRMNPVAFTALPDAWILGTQGTGAGNYGPDRISKNTYDDAGQLTQVQRALNTSDAQIYAKYTYRPNGKQELVTDANGNVAKMEYDGFDRLYRWDFPSKTSPGTVNTSDYEQYGYDNDGNRISLRKRDGSIIGYQYDALNRLSFKNIPGSTSNDVYYAYDLRGLQTDAHFGSASGPGIVTAYDNARRVISSINNSDGASRLLSYQYDAEGNRQMITHPDNVVFTYGYDGLDRMQFICETSSPCIAASNPIVKIIYDNQGHRLTLSRASGAATTGYTYDPVSRLKVLTLDLSGVSDDVTFGISTYSPADQVMARNVNNGEYVGPTTVAQFLYAPNGLNQYGTIFGASTVTPSYDLNGNMTGDGTATYTYDLENRLLSATGGNTANVTYDPNGRLLTIDGGPPSSSTHFLFDGDELVAEYDYQGNLQHRYVHGSGTDEPLVWYSGPTISATNRSYLFANQQGSVVAITDHNGAMTRVNTYDIYGNPGTSTSNGGRFQYTGQIWLTQLGLYYYKARMYSPQLGRFMQTDPIGYKDDLDLYTYVNNDPLDHIDPTGTEIGVAYSADYKMIRGAGDLSFVASGPPITRQDVGNFLLDTLPITGEYRAVDSFIDHPSVVGAAIIVASAVDLGGIAKELGAAKASGILPKTRTGPGLVPKSERDPKRFFTPEEREAKRGEQGHQCGNGCGTEIDNSNSVGHHKERHADGGRSVPENHVEVCKPCHKEIHSGDSGGGS